jgi:predicted O-methyltransferase YrrM
MNIIKKYAAGEEILFDHFNDFIEETNLVDKPINIWRNKIKTCKFDCWDCGYCDKIVKAKYGDRTNSRVKVVTKGLVEAVSNNLDIHIEGLTSPRVQALLNYIGKESKVYLEIGTYLGATAAAALSGNTLKAYLVDNWKGSLQPAEADYLLPENDKDEFLMNMEPYKKTNNIVVLDGDLFSLDTTDIKDVDFFFYDGPHDHASVSKAVQKFAPCFSKGAILVFDDANWTDTYTGADEGIKKAGLTTVYKKKVINKIESKKDWWNGLYIIVLE